MSANGKELPQPPETGVLVGSLYVEFLAFGREIRPRTLWHIPDAAAGPCGQLVEALGKSIRARGSRIIRPVP